MILKLFGAFFILISSSAAGYYFSMKDKYRIDDLRQMKRALMLLKGEIDFSSSPLPEAFHEASLRISGPVSELMEDFSQRLCLKKGENAALMWEEVLKEKSAETYFHLEDLEIFISFGRSLGFLDRQQQMNQILMATNYIDQTETELLQKSAKNSKMYRSMGVLLGALLTVALF